MVEKVEPGYKQDTFFQILFTQYKTYAKSSTIKIEA